MLLSPEFSRRAKSSRMPRPESAELSALYQEMILDHYRRPRNKGTLEGADATVEMKNPLCGDEIALQQRLNNYDRLVGLIGSSFHAQATAARAPHFDPRGIRVASGLLPEDVTADS